MRNGAGHTLRIRGGRVIDPARHEDAVRDLCVADGRIVASLPGKPDRTIDAGGLVVCPGFVEPHAIAPPGGVDARFARQALAGGYTTVAAFGTARRARDFDGPCPRLLRIAPLTAPGTRRLAELGDAAEAGAVGFGDGPEPHADAELLRRGLLYARMLGKPIFDLPRDAALSEGGVAAEGPVAARLGLFGVPEFAETVALERGVTLAKATAARLHFTAVTTDAGCNRLRSLAPHLPQVTFAVPVAHLLVDTGALETFDPAGRVDPPFRDHASPGLRSLLEWGQAVRPAIGAQTNLRGVNVLPRSVMLTSGHRPDPDLLDPVDLLAAPPGYEALETAAAAALTAVRHDDLPPAGAVQDGTVLADLFHLLSVRPAALLGRPTPRLEPGAPADLAILDPTAEWVCDPDELAVPVARTPLAGRALRGRVTHTILGGRVAFDRGRFPEPGATDGPAG